MCVCVCVCVCESVRVCECVCKCVFADRMGFCGKRQPPEWGREQIGV